MRKAASLVILILISTNVLDAIAQQSSPAPVEKTQVERVQPQSPEERMIRDTYQKLVVYNRAAALLNANGHADQVTADAVLQFQLKDFHTGPIDEIKNISELERWPDGEVIMITHGTHRVNNDPESAYYQAQWTEGMDRHPARPEYTLGELLGLVAEEYFDVDRYTSYQVTVTFEGKSRTYRALVLHRSNSRGLSPAPAFWDSIGAGGELLQIYKERVPPFNTESLHSREFRGARTPQ